MIGWNAFDVNVENKRFTVVCLQLKLSRCYLAESVEQVYERACSACSTIILPHSTNHLCFGNEMTVVKKVSGLV